MSYEDDHRFAISGGDQEQNAWWSKQSLFYTILQGVDLKRKEAEKDYKYLFPGVVVKNNCELSHIKGFLYRIICCYCCLDFVWFCS